MKDRYKGYVGASELKNLLESDPEWVAAEAEREKARKEKAEMYARDAAPIRRDLANVGHFVRSLYDLEEPYPRALPVLLQHLKKYDSYLSRTREGIAHALITKDMKKDLHLLIEAFREDPDNSVNGPKWILGNAIEELFDDRYVEEIVQLSLDRRHGPARDCLVYALAKSKKEIAARALEELKSDPEMAPFVKEVEKRVSKRNDIARKRRAKSLEKLKSNLHETSMNFDIDQIQGALDTIAKKLDKGFGTAQIRKIMTEIKNMDPRENSLLEFQLKTTWRTVPLQIVIEKCDDYAADLHFFSTSAIVAVIDRELERIIESDG